MQKLLKITVFAVCFFMLCFGMPSKADDFMDSLIDDSTETLDLSGLQLEQEHHHGNKPPKPVQEIPNPSTNNPVQSKPLVVHPKPPYPRPPQTIVSGDTNEVSQSELDAGIDDSTNSFDISWIIVPPPKPPVPTPPQETEIPESDKPATPTEDPTYGKPVDPSDIPLSLADYLAWLHKIEELYPGYFEDETMFPASKEDVNSTAGIRLQLLTLTTPMHTADWINYWINKLATAVKVESINSVTGAVQLVGKNGIKVEPKANNEIWISSTGGGGGSIGVYGVQSPDSDYEYFGNITSLKFNKDSGFSVTPDDQADLLVSLGSSWTELIPDFPAEGKDNLRPSGEEKLSIKAVVTNKTGTFWDYGETNKDKKTFYIGIGRSEIGGTIPYENVYVSSDIVVTNLPYPIGAYTNGSIISNDTTVAEVFANMFARVMHPVYRLPVITISLTGITMSENYCEYGFSAADVHVKSNVKTNEGGMIEKYIYYVNDVKKGTNIVSHTNDTWKLPSQYLVSYMTLKSQVFYGQGPILPDTSGKPDDYGRIEAGDRMSDAKVISPSKYVYYGTFSEYYQINPEDIGTIINLPTRDYIAKYGNGLTISLRQGIRHTVFAVPSNVSVTKVLFVVPGQADDNITETIQNSAKTVPGVYWNTYTENNKTQYTIYDYYSSAPTLNDSASLKISMTIPKN